MTAQYKIPNPNHNKLKGFADLNTCQKLEREIKDVYFGTRANIVKNVENKVHVAFNLDTPEETLRDLAKDEDAEVRLYVASNPYCPIDALRCLAKDEEWDVRQLVSQNGSTDSKILQSIFDFENSLVEPNEYIIKALYDNPKLPYIAKVVIETKFGDMVK